MKDLVPLFQTLIWAGLILFLAIYLRRDIELLRKTLARRIEMGSSFKLGPVEVGELREEINLVRKDIATISYRVSQLFLTTMTSSMYLNLKKLNSGTFGSYVKSRGLMRELYHLRDIGYITVEAISEIPEQGEDLSVYIKVTQTGRDFIDLREAVLNDKEKTIYDERVTIK